ncbi:hypothetical protein NP233_g2735 [Leucocoprinus birnbaumii]|uniref:Glucose-methanol-choline oxidoreductase N-terminal domain-containing protein n=1 Tax=Leucocoprinus birnbaumii TaxID=56174 RepID=A0AAD5W0V0_9AGAR|nr:hypothetical protein NP233_g2735 [Leucocoprinus birnbaumii]
MPRIELKEAIGNSYDFIVVGGGTAGLVLAARLAEEKDISVLVLEAGEDKLDDPLITKIGHFGQTFGQEEYDWCAVTTPQVNAYNTVFPWPRGRTLGGSSAVNFFAWTKPSREDIDAWEQLGNKGWNWDTFNKYMQRAITFTPPKLSDEEHAQLAMVKALSSSENGALAQLHPPGPIQVSYPPLRTDLDIKVQQAFQEMGIEFATAPLDGQPNGIVLGPATVDPNSVQRSFAGNAYWKPNSGRSNLYLLTGATVHRIVSTEVDGELLISGVEFSHKDSGGDVFTAKASKEVILCAGCVHSLLGYLSLIPLYTELEPS